MSGLGEFLKAVAEGKSHYEENDPKGIQQKQIREVAKKEAKIGLADLFKELASLKQQVEQVENQSQENIDIPILEKEEVQPQQIIEEQIEPKPIKEDMGWGQNDIQQYVKSDAFKQHKPVWQAPGKDTAELKTLKDQIKMLEQWISRIASTGAGSGEVNFRYLDDVNRFTMESNNDNWVLEYDAATGKVQFTDDVGPIQTLRFNTSHIHDEVRAEGTMCWNNVDKTVDLTQNEVTQQIGQEIYALVRNRTGSTITNGTFVRFSGAEENGVARLLVTPFLGDGTYPNLFGLGVATEDIADDADGFVTTFGKIRGINTTNTGITSETWQVGDILYVSPTNAGKLTRVKPTAPNNVIPVAAVLRVDDEIGELFVRPTYEQKSTYGTFSDTTPQYVAETATSNPEAVYPITFNTTDVANGHRRGVDTSHIIAEVSGLYNYKFSIQFVSTNSSAKDVYIWFRKNGNDIPNSASRITITGNGVYSVAAWDISVSMDANDYFQIMWAATSTAVHIAAPTSTEFCPAIPSVILTVTEVAL
jgi:hypothetical protein